MPSPNCRCLPASRCADESAYSWDQSRELPRNNMNSFRRRDYDLNTHKVFGQAFNTKLSLNSHASNYPIRSGSLVLSQCNSIQSFPSRLRQVVLLISTRRFFQRLQIVGRGGTLMRTTSFPRSHVRFWLWFCHHAACWSPFATCKRAGGLVFSVKTWEGDYTSKDVPNGVESTPVIGAIYTVKADGSGLKKIIQPGKSRARLPNCEPRWSVGVLSVQRLRDHAGLPLQVGRNQRNEPDPTGSTHKAAQIFRQF